MGKVSINTQATIHIITRGPIQNPRKLSGKRLPGKSILKRINRKKFLTNVSKKKQKSGTTLSTTIKI